MSSVPKNSRGGVQVTEAEISAAFQFFDVDGRGKITTANVGVQLVQVNLQALTRPVSCLVAKTIGSVLQGYARTRLSILDEQQTRIHGARPSRIARRQ